MPDAWQIVEAVNELCVAVQLIDLTLTGHYTLTYEPRVTLTGASIDFLLSSKEETRYYDVKTIRPRDPADTEKEWAKYEQLRTLFPTNADLMLAKSYMGGEFWHFFSSARAKFLNYSLLLEAKIAKLPQRTSQSVRMVFCGDGFRWTRDQLEDFADFYRTGMFRNDDPLRTLQRHYLVNKGIVLARTIHGFCYLERQPFELNAKTFLPDVKGPTLP